jgi:hypothetical protein
MLTVLRWLAGWGAGFAPAALLAGLSLVDRRPEIRILAIVSALSAFVFGLLGAVLAGMISGIRESDAVPTSACVAALPPAALAFLGLLLGARADDPAIWIWGAVAFLLPAPIAGASTAWILRKAVA